MSYHVRLLVSGFAECFEFYSGVLGFAVRMGSPEDVYAEFETGGPVLAIFRRKLMSAVLKNAHLPVYTETQDRAALVLRVPDVDRSYQELRAKGIQFVTEPHDQPAWHLRVAHLRDPDGNLLELWMPR